MGTTPLVALLALTAGVEGLAWLLGGVVTSIILSRTVCTVRTVRTTCSDGTSTALLSGADDWLGARWADEAAGHAHGDGGGREQLH
jgi:hypothetical protein